MKYSYDGVAVVITNPSKNLFYLQQKDNSYAIKEYRLGYTFFGGGVEKNETEKEAFKREIYEEFNQSVAEHIIKKSKRHLCRRLCIHYYEYTPHKTQQSKRPD